MYTYVHTYIHIYIYAHTFLYNIRVYVAGYTVADARLDYTPSSRHIVRVYIFS